MAVSLVSVLLERSYLLQCSQLKQVPTVTRLRGRNVRLSYTRATSASRLTAIDAFGAREPSVHAVCASILAVDLRQGFSESTVPVQTLSLRLLPSFAVLPKSSTYVS